MSATKATQAHPWSPTPSCPNLPGRQGPESHPRGGAAIRADRARCLHCVSFLRDAGGRPIGTCVRAAAKQGPVILALRRCVVDKGKCLPDLTAFGGAPLRFVVASPWLGVAVFRGPDGPTLDLSGDPLRCGELFAVLSYPPAHGQEEQHGGSSSTAPAAQQGDCVPDQRLRRLRAGSLVIISRLVLWQGACRWGCTLLALPAGLLPSSHCNTPLLHS